MLQKISGSTFKDHGPIKILSGFRKYFESGTGSIRKIIYLPLFVFFIM